MSNIKPIQKWDLKRECWRQVETLEDKKKALSVVPLGNIIHRENEPFNYIIIADGYRVENVSKDASTVSKRRKDLSNVLRYFEGKKENYYIELLLIDNDAPLSEESRAFALYIDNLANHPSARTINYVGFSKCGVIGLDMLKYFKNPQTFSKTRVYSVSSPYRGTIFASPKAFIAETRKIIVAKLGDNALSTKVADALEKKYRRVLSNSHMDLDIAIRGGVPDDMFACYDPRFLKDIFSEANIAHAKKVSHYQNICTRVDSSTLKNAIRYGNLESLGLCIVNDVLMGGNSDGIVSYESQSAIEDHFDDEHKSSVIIPSTHNSLSIPVYADELFDIVHDGTADKRISLVK